MCTVVFIREHISSPASGARLLVCGLAAPMHLLGASGAVEGAACVLAIRDQIVPPTINYKHPDPECDLNYVPNEAQACRVRVTLSNSLGFGGHNACIAFKAYQE